ncbi:MAG: hypothetical protein G01um1014107_278, partial [Parcubacteria group bacterium Gr01-1014_107]
MNRLKNFSSTAKVIILALLLSLGVGVIFAQWYNPSGPFPQGQPPAPVNVGPASQVKSGSFWAGFLGSDSSLYVSGNGQIVGNALIGGDALIGGRITIGGGSPAAGKVLSSEDSAGLGEWVDLQSSFTCLVRQTVD